MSELYNLEVHPNGLSFTATDAEGWMGQSLEVLAKWDGCMQIRPPEDPNRWEDVWFWRNKARGR